MRALWASFFYYPHGDLLATYQWFLQPAPGRLYPTLRSLFTSAPTVLWTSIGAGNAGRQVPSLTQIKSLIYDRRSTTRIIEQMAKAKHPPGCGGDPSAVRRP